MRLWVLGSSSAGNAVLLESGETRVLVDAGFHPRTLAARLHAIGVPPGSIAAALITHEHGDHVRGACAGARRWGWALYATRGTIAAVPELAAAGAQPIGTARPVAVGDLALHAMPTSHDAAEPVGVVATDTRTGARAGIAYDLGRADAGVHRALQDLELLVLEANHDPQMLRAGPYPRSVQARIASARGHLSNAAAASLACACAGRTLAHLVLAHLSVRCNDPHVATHTVGSALARTAFRGALHTAPPQRPIGPFLARRAAPAATQLALAL
ncbi:MAG TPA: MBL fold metallo-hydrolase [Gemmatimonadaceae bacterium]|nr:MBL fold metallo-hydrolase [Gemmatimonadaceae bacterium]